MSSLIQKLRAVSKLSPRRMILPTTVPFTRGYSNRSEMSENDPKVLADLVQEN